MHQQSVYGMQLNHKATAVPPDGDKESSVSGAIGFPDSK